MLPGNRFLVRTRRGALAGGVLLVLLVSPELHAEAKPRLSCFALPHAAAPQDGGEASRHEARGSEFDVYETSAIELDVHCVGQPPSQLRVQLHLPNGDIYETLDAVSSPGPPAFRRGKWRRSPLATARLPVAGTFITQYGLVGTWRARVCWEEASRPSCGRAVRFSLER